MADILVADVGGTFTRVAVFAPSGRRKVYHKFESRAYPSLTALLHDFASRHKLRVSKASIAIAGPVREGKVVMPNLAWHVDTDLLKHALKCKNVMVHNDAAVAAIGCHGAGKVRVKPGSEGEGAMLVIGVGTGVGAALALPDMSTILATEAGHADFAPQTKHQQELWEWLHRRYAHVSIERVLSGQGIVETYRLLREEKAALESNEARQAIDTATNPGRAIVAMGVGQTDSLARLAVLNFVSALGGVSGSLALSTGASSVYLYGSLLNAMRPFIDSELFRVAFERKGRMQKQLADLPVFLVTDDDVVLRGAAMLAGVKVSAKNWR